MPVFAIADNIISPLGITTEENFSAMLRGESGISRHEAGTIHTEPFYASLMRSSNKDDAEGYTRFEKLLIHSISQALNESGINITSASTGLIIATTKGNIGLAEAKTYPAQKLPLHYSAHLVANHFGNPNEPIVISNACISGLTALLTAKRLIECNRFKNVVVAGADIITRFVFSGFNAFQAISNEPCKPYDAQRRGVTLGEAAATIILSAEGNNQVRISGQGASNDANHISGPSRTGEELAIAMKRAISSAGILPSQVDYISAHGTATLYNDEMEAKAINLASLQAVPVNSVKGYFGHTLGAAGILESVIAMQSMKAGIILPTMGYSEPGMSKEISVVSAPLKKQVTHCLKTASGFGGCNASVMYSN